MTTRRENPSCPIDDCPREHCADCPYSTGPRKAYTKPTVTVGPRDDEDCIEALCALNPYM